MNIKNYKRKLVVLSLVLILTGSIISLAGFGSVGFKYNRLKEKMLNDKWYQTIHINSNDDPWYGIDFGNNIHLFVFGDSD
jgi:hypothetical protein